LNYLTDSSAPLTHINEVNSLPPNDEIKKHICHPDILPGSNHNQLYIANKTDFEAQPIFPNVANTAVQQSVSKGTNPIELLYTDRNEQNLDDPSSHLSSQFAQPIQLVPLSTSLQFVHDVHPCQKTQHDTENSIKCPDEIRAAYVTRLQGVKTDADKGKNIPPRLKVSGYLSRSGLNIRFSHIIFSLIVNRNNF
jgi:hypothetical protein